MVGSPTSAPRSLHHRGHYRFRLALLGVTGLTVTLLTTVTPAASAATAPVAPGTPIASLPFVATAGLTPASGTGGPGSAVANAAVAQACNSGAPLFNPQWFTLPVADLGPVYGNLQASYYWGAAHSPTEVPMGAAVVDSVTGQVLQCGISTPFTVNAAEPLTVVAFLPVDPQLECLADPNEYCYQTWTSMQMYLGTTTGVAPANDDLAQATVITSLPFTATVDTSFADPDFPDAGGNPCYLSVINGEIDHTVWWKYTPTVTGPAPVISTQGLFQPRSNILEQTAGGWQFVVGVDDYGYCNWLPPVLQAGVTYYFALDTEWDSYYQLPPLVPGGSFTMTVTASPVVPDSPATVAVSTNDAARTATLSWSPPANPGGAVITGYRVSRDGTDSGNTGPYSTVLPATARSLTFKYLLPWSTYNLSVDAINQVGDGTAASVQTSLTAPTPSTPQAVGAAVGAVGSGQATVTWTPPAQLGTTAITGYRVREFVASTGTTPVSTTTLAGTARSFTASGLTPGTGYTFDVTAINTGGAGLVSPLTVAVVPLALPAVPTGLAVTAATGTTGGAATLTWVAPTLTGGSPITGYKVSRNGTDTKNTGPYTTVVPSTTRTLTFKYLLPGNTYALAVSAITAVGTGAAATTSILVPAATPSAPQSVAATVGAVGSGQATVSWTPPAQTGATAITGYRIRQFVGSATTAAVTTTVAATARSLTVAGLTAGTGYTFDVAAINTAGTGLVSPRTAAVVPLALPAVPTGVSATATTATGTTGGTATLTWVAPTVTGGSPVTGYKVTRNGTDTNNTGAYSAVLAATARSVAFKNLLPWNTYALTVSAITAAGTGPIATANILIPGTAPSVPQAVVATAGNKQITLTWTPPAHTGTTAITSYVIRRYLGAGTTATVTTTLAATARTYVSTGLTNGTGYTYTITATNTAGPGTASARSAVTTPHA